VISELQIIRTGIDGLLVVRLPVHLDNRGWFKENWNRQKMIALGLPDFNPVQNNVSFNDGIGTTRGLHAEPWDKLVSVTSGKVFGAWVDLREGDGFGRSFALEIDASIAVFVPRGVANGFQTLEPDTAYSYLVNDHWSAGSVDGYSFVNLGDPALGIDWPIPLNESVIGDKDLVHPDLKDIQPVPPRRVLVIGSDGQLGRALRKHFLQDSRFEYVTRSELDLASSEWEGKFHWREYEFVINAAAYTKVDLAETMTGRVQAWATNACGSSRLAHLCEQNGVTLVHISSDYVFDGDAVGEYSETAPLSPVSVYGQTKAAGDIAIATCTRHYILRTSWVIGDGANFVRTMHGLALESRPVNVVNDQFGRLTFASTLAQTIGFLINARPSFGTYNITNAGPIVSWFEIARMVYELSGADPSLVNSVSTDEYLVSQPSRGLKIAPRPKNSTLNLDKAERAGFALNSWVSELEQSLAIKFE
jgi:dTDP-4-dehydrorhamnose reductase/dTDP-4-dehydrorhamnose 3,5-epimerase